MKEASLALVNPCVPSVRRQLDMGHSSTHTSEQVLTPLCIYTFISILSVVSWWMEPSYSIKVSLVLPGIQTTKSSCNVSINRGTRVKERTYHQPAAENHHEAYLHRETLRERTHLESYIYTPFLLVYSNNDYTF